VLKISILFLNFFKWGFSALNFEFLDDNFQITKIFLQIFYSPKFMGAFVFYLPCLPPATMPLIWDKQQYVCSAVTTENILQMFVTAPAVGQWSTEQCGQSQSHLMRFSLVLEWYPIICQILFRELWIRLLRAVATCCLRRRRSHKLNTLSREELFLKCLDVVLIGIHMLSLFWSLIQLGAFAELGFWKRYLICVWWCTGTVEYTWHNQPSR